MQLPDDVSIKFMRPVGFYYDMFAFIQTIKTQGAMEKANEKLATSDLPVNEIAYGLGFEHPQSFSKLFKTKTNFSPLGYRHLFNCN